MNFDWNWFFSSFSQSAAALLGIIAAFIITRLVGLNEKISFTIDGFEELKANYFKLTEKMKLRHPNEYNNEKLNRNDNLKQVIAKRFS